MICDHVSRFQKLLIPRHIHMTRPPFACNHPRSPLESVVSEVPPPGCPAPFATSSTHFPLTPGNRPGNPLTDSILRGTSPLKRPLKVLRPIAIAMIFPYLITTHH